MSMNFINDPPTAAHTMHDRAQKQSESETPHPLPDTNDPMVLLGLEPDADFDAVRRVYRQMAKEYHPDVSTGPDASPDEKKLANWDFARINAAFDILKRKKDEQVVEYHVYVEGKRVTRSVDLSGGSYPYRSDHQETQDMVRFDKVPKKTGVVGGGKMCEFGVHQSYTCDANSKGKWRVMKGYERKERTTQTDTPAGFGFIPSREAKMWEDGLQSTNWGSTTSSQRNTRNSFVVDSPREQWWEERSSFNFDKVNKHELLNSGKHSINPRRGYPFRDKLWNVRNVQSKNMQIQERAYSVKNRWWKADERSSGDFAP